MNSVPALLNNLTNNRLFKLSLFLVLTYGILIKGELEPKDDEDVKATQQPNIETTSGTVVENVGFLHAFVASLSVILVSEIGDKTFFIAAIMAMRHPRLIVFGGAIAALALMTVLSALFGWLVNVIPRVYTYYISTALMAIFGIKMLKEGCQMSRTEGQEELEEVQMELRQREEEHEREDRDRDAPTDVESGNPKRNRSIWYEIFRIFLQAFTLTFLAEWGDRSQLTTIILGARENVYGVIIGGILGHSLCTGVAVLGGRMIAQRISVRTVTIIGGVVFLIFAFSSLFFDPSATEKISL